MAYADKQLVALLPVYIQHSLQWPHLKIMYPLGQGEPEEAEISSEYCDAIIAKKFEATVLPELQKKLAELDIDKTLWNAILQSSHIKGVLETVFKYSAVTTHSRYCIERSKWTLQSLSKNTRARYKRSNNQLKKSMLLIIGLLNKSMKLIPHCLLNAIKAFGKAEIIKMPLRTKTLIVFMINRELKIR
jgi:hypothetical protein